MLEVGDLRVVPIVIIYSDGLPSVSQEGGVRTLWTSVSGAGAEMVYRYSDELLQ